MARERDLPGWLAGVHPKYRVPHHAEIALAVVVCVLVAFFDLREVIGFSSFGVLLYYAIANASAYRQTEGRRYPRALQVLGFVLCVVIARSPCPGDPVVVIAAVLALGLAGRAVVLGDVHPRRIRRDFCVRASWTHGHHLRTPAPQPVAARRHPPSPNG